MARKILTFDRSPAAVTVACHCGWRTLQLTDQAAQAAADGHRNTAHRRQAIEAASKRRARGTR